MEEDRVFRTERLLRSDWLLKTKQKTLIVKLLMACVFEGFGGIVRASASPTVLLASLVTTLV